MAYTSANQLELLQTAEAVAREKNIEPGLVVEAMEESLARAAKSRYGAEMDIRVSIDRKTGRATFTRVRTVVEDEELENYQAEFTVEQAKQYLEDPAVGDTYVEEVPPVELGRIAAQSAKQVILQKVREAERDKQYEEFKDRAGTIINALVKREEYGNVIVDVGAGEAVLRRNEKIGREAYRPNDRIRCYIKDVRREQRGRKNRPRGLPPQRPYPLLHQGCAPRAARASDLPQPHRARVHGRAVQDGSARDLRGYHRNQGRRP